MTDDRKTVTLHVVIAKPIEEPKDIVVASVRVLTDEESAEIEANRRIPPPAKMVWQPKPLYPSIKDLCGPWENNPTGEMKP